MDLGYKSVSVALPADQPSRYSEPQSHCRGCTGKAPRQDRGVRAPLLRPPGRAPLPQEQQRRPIVHPGGRRAQPHSADGAERDASRGPLRPRQDPGSRPPVRVVARAACSSR
jgi:hypothetical protein